MEHAAAGVYQLNRYSPIQTLTLPVIDDRRYTRLHRWMVVAEFGLFIIGITEITGAVVAGNWTGSRLWIGIALVILGVVVIGIFMNRSKRLPDGHGIRLSVDAVTFLSPDDEVQQTLLPVDISRIERTKHYLQNFGVDAGILRKVFWKTDNHNLLTFYLNDAPEPHTYRLYIDEKAQSEQVEAWLEHWRTVHEVPVAYRR